MFPRNDKSFSLLLRPAFAAILACFSMFCGASSGGIIVGDATSRDGAAVVVEWKATLSKSAGLKIGDEIVLTITGSVKAPGWHLYSSADGGAGYKTTSLILEKESIGLVLVSPLRDKQKPYSYYDDLMMDSIRYFKNHAVSFEARLKVTAANPVLSGYFEYQVCVDPEGGGKCMFPYFDLLAKLETEDVAENGIASLSVSLTNDSIPRDSGTASAEPDSSRQSVKDTSSLPAAISDLEENRDRPSGNQSLFLIFLEAFLFGFAAVLTPCVFPMIPLTVTFFTKQSKTRSRGIANALTYAGFIVAIYTIFGILLSVALGPDFMYQLSVNPWVNLAFFILLFVFALSFLGMFELTLPGSWASKIDSQSNRGGVIGIFFMALTLAIVSFSCTGPLVGTALIRAFSGSVMGPFMAMLGFSLALSIPFGLLAIFPGWLNSMPKSGGWLNSVKVVLGFLELALGMKFLSQTDLYLKWHILDREIFIGSWVVIFALLGLYLLGKLRLPHDSPIEKLSVPRLMLSMSCLIFTCYLFTGLWGANLGAVSGLLPPHNRDVGVRIIGQKNRNEGTFNRLICELENRKYFQIFEEKEGHGFCTFYDLEEAVAFGKKHNMPLFLDFTGHTCANCRLMENNVWIKPQIEKILKNEFVMVSLYADDTTRLLNPEVIGDRKVRTIGQRNLQYQIINYETFAQPYYVILDPWFEKSGSKFSNLSFPVDYQGGRDELDYKKFLDYGIGIFRQRHGKPRGNMQVE